MTRVCCPLSWSGALAAASPRLPYCHAFPTPHPFLPRLPHTPSPTSTPSPYPIPHFHAFPTPHPSLPRLAHCHAFSTATPTSFPSSRIYHAS
ncbi:hypothetical protein Pcinc_039193 [Petrolisthes cinctipes]|uniref:Uncharacterized protein n=1 Tax=Petrolisthes cinctipes TaxID=88211 RepID=A0AAE1BP01_PETCI|nr:hypothetical protein Pcinc_039193 [Petrolisthes cinctipes]